MLEILITDELLSRENSALLLRINSRANFVMAHESSDALFRFLAEVAAAASDPRLT
jgi:hypothetical protein